MSSNRAAYYILFEILTEKLKHECAAENQTAPDFLIMLIHDLMPSFAADAPYEMQLRGALTLYAQREIKIEVDFAAITKEVETRLNTPNWIYPIIPCCEGELYTNLMAEMTSWLDSIFSSLFISYQKIEFGETGDPLTWTHAIRRKVDGHLFFLLDLEFEERENFVNKYDHRAFIAYKNLAYYTQKAIQNSCGNQPSEK